MFTKPLLVCLFSAGLLATAHPAQAQEEKSADYGLGVNARQLQLTRGLDEVFTEKAPGGTRTNGASVEFSKRGKQLEFVFGFGYDDLNASDGYYLETAGDPLTPGEVDFTEFQKFHVYTIDATLLGYLKLHKILALRYGAGLGVGIVRGKVLRTDAICTSSNIQQDCVPDPAGAQQRKAANIPKAIPVLNMLAGIQCRPLDLLAINIDIGLRNVPYIGASAMFYLW